MGQPFANFAGHRVYVKVLVVSGQGYSSVSYEGKVVSFIDGMLWLTEVVMHNGGSSRESDTLFNTHALTFQHLKFI